MQCLVMLICILIIVLAKYYRKYLNNKNKICFLKCILYTKFSLNTLFLIKCLIITCVKVKK